MRNQKNFNRVMFSQPKKCWFLYGFIILLGVTIQQAFAQPSNDNFENRIMLSGYTVSTSGSNVNATTQTGEPERVDNQRYGATVWWGWIAPANGQVTIDTIGSTFNTVLGVYTGTLGSLTTIAQNNDIGGGTNQSRVTFTAVAGTEYKILVGGTRIFGNFYNTGQIRLNISMVQLITLTSPTNGSIYAEGAQINISVSVGSSLTNISTVEFYRSSTLLGTDSTSPYSLIVTNTPVGTNSFYAVAVSSQNTRITSDVATVTVFKPGLTIISPSDGANFTFTNLVPISAVGVVASGSITNTAFYANNEFIGTGVAGVSSPIYYLNWTSATSGVHKIHGIAWANNGVTYTSTPIFIAIAYRLVPSNSVWKYLDDGTDQGTAWRALEFDDSRWGEGPAELGYGDSGDGRPENTLLNYGPDSNNKYITYYFRKKVVIPDPLVFTNFIIRVMRDDGAVVYINGQEAGRFNMPQGTITYTTLANNAGDDGQIFYEASIPSSMFVAGTNIIAVEVHQSSVSSTDLSFDFELQGIPVIIRNQVPIFTQYHPTNGMFFIGPKSITLSANVYDADGTIAKVEFYVNKTLVGTSTNAPYQYNWINPTVGEHTITITAIDNLNGVSSVNANIVVFDQYGTPIVRITSPKDGTVYSGLTNYIDVQISADVISPTNLSRVMFYANNTLIGSVQTYPYIFTWQRAWFGTNILTAAAQTTAGIIGTSQPITVVLVEPPRNTNPPVIVTVSPARGSILSTLTNIQVTFSEIVTGVDASDLLVNGVPAISVTGSGSNYTFTVVEPGYGIVYITWATNHGITDFGYPTNLLFDATAPGATWTYQLVDLTPPVIVSQDPPAGSTVSSLYQVTVTFSEPVTNVDAADLLVNNAPAISLRGGGTNFTFGFPQPPPGTVNISWAANHGITDIATSPNPFNHTAPGATWSYFLDPRYVLVESNSVWQFRKGTNEASVPMNAWRFLDFNASNWSNAPAPFFFGDTGYTNAQVRGTTLSDMQGNYTCIFLRKYFVVSNVNAITNLVFNAQSDDGFIAWINGVEVLRYNMPSGELAYNAVASSAAPEPNNNGAAWITYELPNPSPYLLPGTNVLAVQAFNVSLTDSSDFGFNAQLYTYLLTAEAVPPRIKSVEPAAGTVYSLTSITVTFTEPVTGVNASDMLINGVPATGVTGGNSNSVYTFTFPQPAYGNVYITWITNHGIVDFDAVQKSFDANAVGSTWQYMLINPNAPAVVNQTPPAGSTVTQLTSITINFNKPVTGLDASDLLINGVPATNVVGSNTIYTFYFSQPAYGNVTIGWNSNHGIKDNDSPPNDFNPYQPGNIWTYKLVDKTPPFVVNVLPARGSTVSNLTMMYVQFSEPVTGVDASDLLINGVAARTVSIIGNTYRFTFTQPNATVVRITWSPNHGITDTASEPNAFDPSNPTNTWIYYTFDNIPPAVVSIDPPPNSTVTGIGQITIKFNEEVQNVTSDDLMINGKPARSVTGSGAGPYVFTFQPVLSGTVEVRWSPECDITDFANPPNKFANGEWSYYVAANVSYAGKIIINEIMFNPISGKAIDEWIELRNLTTNLINVAGFKLTRGVTYTFPNVSIPGSGYLVVAADVNTFKAKHPSVTNVVGGWTGTLANTDETIELQSATGEVVDRVHYASEGDWAMRVRGSGASLVESITRSGSTATVTIQGHGYAAGDAVILMGADQPEYNGRFTVGTAGTSTFTITVSGTPATPATGRIICFRASDRGFSGVAWFCEADGFGASMELVNPNLPNEYGQNWKPSTTLHGTPGTGNSVYSENIAPLILDVTHMPAVPRSTNSITITARVIDEMTNGVQSVVLYYRNHSTTSPGVFSTTQMFDDGLHNDGLPADGIYGVVLNPMANGTIVEFYIMATDVNGNSRTYPAPVWETNGPNSTFGTFEQTANCLFQVDDEIITNPMPWVRLVMTATDRNIFPPSNRNSDAEFNTTMIAEDGNGIAIRYNCSVRVRGAGTRSRTPTNNRLNIPNDNRWNNLRAVNINSQFIHASLMGNVVAQKSGLPSTDAHVIQYRINGQNLAPLTAPQNGTGNGAGWGTFLMLKPVNGDLLDDLFPDDQGGNVYRASTGNHNADLSYQGTNISSYIARGYTKTSNQSENDWTDLFKLCEAMSYTGDEATYISMIQSNVNVTYWMRYFAVGSLINFGETSLFNGRGDDYALYRGIKDPRFVLIGHDYDTIFGQGDTGAGYYPIATNSSIYIMINPPNPNSNVPLLRRFMTNGFAPLFFGELKRLCDTVFHPDNLNPLFDQYLRNWGVGPDENTISSMKTWAYNRRAIVLSQIPLVLTVSNNLSQQSGYYVTTTPGVTLFGTANAIETRKVLVNGAQAFWAPWSACWTNTVSLQPGINRILIEAVNSNGVVFASTNLDIWYNSGSTRSVSGAITTDTVWTAVNGPYQVTGTITVNNGVTLTIQPGTTVYFNSGVGITVAAGGRLIAEGTPTAMIRFTRAPGTSTTWSGIRINGDANSPETRISYAIIEYNSSTAIYSSGGTVYLDHIIFNTTSAQYLSLDNSSFVVSYCHFPQPGAAFEPIHGSGGIKAGGRGIFYRNFVGAPTGYNDAIDFTGGNRPNQPILQVIENVFMGSADDILDLDGTDAWVEGNIFLHCHRNGSPDTASAVSGGSDSGNTSEITIVRNIFFNCDHAAMAKQGNFYTMLNNTIVRITHAGGTDTDSAAIAVADEGYPEGAGMYLENNVLYDVNKLVQFLTNAIVTYTNNLLPVAWNGRGGGNIVVADPMFKYVPAISETTNFSNWAQAQVMWDWFSLKPGSPAAGRGPGNQDLGAVVPRGVYVIGVPSGTSSLNSLTLQVGFNRTGNGIPASSWGSGSGYTHYKWRLDNSSWSAELPITTPIVLQNLADGPHYIEVIGKNDAGYYQNDTIFLESANVTRTRTWYTRATLPPIRLNEILALNRGVLTNNNATPDLLELYNESDEPFDLFGMRLTDDPDNPDKYIFPTNSIIPPRGYLVVYCDNSAGGAGYFTGFGLNQDGDKIYLYDSRERGGRLVDSREFGPQIPDFSIGKLADGSWNLTIPTFGAPNRPAPLGDPRKVKINEWMALGETPFENDFIELYNTDPLPVNIGGLYITDSVIGYLTRHQIAPLSFIPGYGFLRFFSDGDPSKGPLHLSFRLSAFQGGIGLFDTNLIAIDIVMYQPQWKNISQGRSPNGSSTIAYFTSPTPGSPNPLISGPSSGAALVINEVLAVNTSLAELDGSTPDWVEIYNGTSSAIDLSDYSLSDDTERPRRFVFPNGTILQPGRFLRIFCDGNKPASTNNTGFGLAGNGGGVYLYDKPSNGGSLLDSVVYGIQTANLSIGRVPNGGTNWVLNSPTPGAANVAITQLAAPTQLKINEWMASPKSGNDWFEIYNPANQPIAVSSLYLTDDLNRRLKHQIAPLSFIGAKSYLIIWADNNTGAGADHVNFALSANGEAIGISLADGTLIDAVVFGPQSEGVSEGRFPDGNTNIVKFPLTESPGEPNYRMLTNVVINEVLARALPPFEDAIELRNLTPQPLDISGWWLSDDFGMLEKYQFPTPTIIPPNGYFVVYAAQFTNRLYAAIPFALNASGDEVVLSQTTNGILTGYRTYVRFGAAAPNVSFGRYVTSDGRSEFTAMKSRTFGKDDPASVEEFRQGTGAPNSEPLVGPVVISEIMYHPPDIGTNDNVAHEYIELKNITSAPVTLYDPYYPTNTWRIRDAVKFDFPQGIVIQPYEEILIVSFDPINNPALLREFRQVYNVDPGTRVFGPYSGKLSNKDGDIELERPFTPTTNNVPYIRVEKVHYYDSFPWPIDADGTGFSLNRLNLFAYGNDPVNWSADPPSPGPRQMPLDFDRDGIPDTWERQFGLDPLSPGDANLDYDDDGFSNLMEYIAGTDPLHASSYLQFARNSIRVEGTNLLINFTAGANRTYTIEGTDNLKGGWTPIYEIQSGNGGVITVRLPINSPRKFFRLRIP